MLLSHRRSQPSGAASTTTAVLLGFALSACGGSSLKAPQTDDGSDGLGGGLTDSAQGTGGAIEIGGTRATGGTTTVVGDAAATAADGATLGMAGAGGATIAIGAGGASRDAGSTGLGGLPAKGGAGGLSGRGGTAGTAVGGTASTGGKPGTGGTPGTGGWRGGTGGGDSTGGTGGTTGGMGGSTGAHVLQPLVDAFCAAAKSCCARAGYPKADIADCEAQLPSRFPYYALVDKGTVRINQSALAACVATYNTAATACTVSGLEAACTGIFVGAQAEGQPCGGTSWFGSYECMPVAGSASCHWPDSASYPDKAGVCITIPHGKAGDSCSRTCLQHDTCIVDMIGGAAPFPVTCFEEDGLYCSVASNPAVCKPILHLDDACTWDVGSCGSGNYCHWTTNTCQIAGKLGESCDNALCAEELACGSNRKCIETPLASESICKGTPSVP